MSSIHGASRPRQIKKIVRRDETIVRINVVASNFQTTWGPGDEQHAVFTDGVNLSEPATECYHSRIYRMIGEPGDLKLEELAGYPHMPMRFTESAHASFWGISCLAVDGTLYQTLHTTNHPYLRPDGSFAPNFRPAGNKLIYSTDGGVQWRNQDGSFPVVWNDWDQRDRSNMMFWEPDGAFADSIFLQMGRNYELNQDGYIYIYSLDRVAAEATDALVVCRVPKTALRDRGQYEFCTGVARDGSASWSREIAARGSIHKFPPGWVAGDMAGAIPAGWWISSVVYNAPLGMYLLAASGTAPGKTGGWFGAPSYLGFWVAPTPWGPFRQVHEEKTWTPEGDSNSKAFRPQIPPRWIAPDGSSFWLVWSDYAMPSDETVGGEFNPDKAAVDALRGITDDVEFAAAFQAWTRRHQPNARLNMQRVDVLIE